MEHDREYVFATDDYKKANKIAGGKDWSSLNILFALQMKTGSFKDAIATVSSLQASSANGSM